MTAVLGGSTTFVPAVLGLVEVCDMYPIPSAMESNRSRNDELRTYSRLEYATPDGTWLLVAAGLLSRRPRTPRRALVAWLRQVAGHALPAPRDEPTVEG